MGSHLQILHPRISLGSKFQLQQNNFDFLEQIFRKKESFRSKTEKMNVTIEYFILELV